MPLILSFSKPRLSDHIPLCSFRSSKSYLWGLVRDRLHSLSPDLPLDSLDAACHSLLTRHIFPPSWNYCGLDISRSRLSSGFAKKKPDDLLFLADLTKPLPSTLLFDVVVSLNTLSHLPEESQITALINLSSCCKPSSYFFVNASVDSNLSALTHLLLSKFDSVEPIYLNSFKSCADEDNGVVNEDNVKDLVV